MAKMKHARADIIDAGTPDGGMRYELELRSRRFVVHAHRDRSDIVALVTEVTPDGTSVLDEWQMMPEANNVYAIIASLERMMDMETRAERREVC